MPKRHRKFHLGVFGESGNGKSTYVYKYLAHAPGCKCCGPVSCRYLFDPEGDFAEDMKLKPVSTPDEIDRAVSTGWVCYDPGTMFPGDDLKGLEFLAAYAYERSKRLPGRKFFVLDESGGFQTGHTVPKSFKIVLQKGRHHGLDGIIIGQQPNELHNTIRSQLSEIVCFQLTDDVALQIPKASWGFDADALKLLQPFQYICRNKRGAQSQNF